MFDYGAAVRRGAMAAARLHVQLMTKSLMGRRGGSVDVFRAALQLQVPILFRPMRGLLGAYLPLPSPGILVTTRRPLTVQRFTAAHEIGHHRMGHQPSLDDKGILRRVLGGISGPAGSPMQEVEANAFAASFLMPQWLILWHSDKQGWSVRDLCTPRVAYQLSLRLGVSYEALTWTLQRNLLISPAEAQVLRRRPRRQLKAEALQSYQPTNYRGDVWLINEADADASIVGSRHDLLVVRGNQSEIDWSKTLAEMETQGFIVLRQEVEQNVVESSVVRRAIVAPNKMLRGQISFGVPGSIRRGDTSKRVTIHYDFEGPEENGLPRIARRCLSLWDR